MSNVEQEPTTRQDADCSFQPATECTGNRKAARTRKQIPTLVAMKSSKPNLKPSSGKRVEETDSNSNSSREAAVSTSQQSSPTIQKSKQKTSQQITENTSHEPKHIPGRQLHSANSIIKQHSKEKRNKSDSSKFQPTQSESFLPNKMPDSTKHSLSSNEISVTEMAKNKLNNSTVKQAEENESAVETNLLKPTSLAADDSNSCNAPKEAVQKDTHGIVNCSDGVLQEPQELNISDHAGINQPKTIHKRRHTTPGVGKGNTESPSNERFPSSVMARRSSRPASVTKEPPPRARRCLSFDRDYSTPGRVRARAERANSIASPESASKKPEENSSSVDSLRTLNLELRDQVTKMRHQLEAQRGNIKHAHWQKVLDLRQLRQQEHERLTLALAEQKEKLDKEKSKEIEQMRDQLTAKGELDLQKLTRHKDAEITKLKMEVSCKDVMMQRLLGENRHAQLKLNIDVRKSKLLDDLKELRREKKELEDTLSSADVAGRTFSNDLRRRSQSFELEIAKVKREAQIEMKQLVS